MNKRIRELRTFLGLSQNEFSERILVGSSTLAMWELGTRNIKDIHISKICSEFHVSEEWLRHGTGELFQRPSSTLVEQIVKEYKLDDIDRRIIEAYLELGPLQRKVIQEYIHSVSAAFNDSDSSKSTHMVSARGGDKEITLSECDRKALAKLKKHLPKEDLSDLI